MDGRLLVAGVLGAIAAGQIVQGSRGVIRKGRVAAGFDPVEFEKLVRVLSEHVDGLAEGREEIDQEDGQPERSFEDYRQEVALDLSSEVEELGIEALFNAAMAPEALPSTATKETILEALLQIATSP